MTKVFKCDRCGKNVEKEHSIRVEIQDWTRVRTIDLCEDCYEEFKTFLDEAKLNDESSV